MSGPDLPLGKRETPRLEFKAAAGLADLSTIGREVVAMLNADGGEIWIGIEEEDGLGTQARAVDDVGPNQRRLHDYLIDAIEPSPFGEELIFEAVAIPKGGEVLLVRVTPKSARKPYALLRGSSRRYLIRVGDRNRPMSREEIAIAFKGTASGDQEIERAEEEMLEARRKVQERGDALFWLRLKPVRSVELELHDREFEDVFRDPKRSGNRATGWTFVNPHRGVALHRESVEVEGSRIHRDGEMVFSLPLANLSFPLKTVGTRGAPALASVFWRGQPGEIHPHALMEYPASALRIARVVYEPCLEEHDLVVADFALLGVRGWTLRPHSPREYQYTAWQGRAYEEASDLVWEKPLVFRYEEIFSEPDWCAYRLAIRRTYEAFGYGEDEIPAEFDRNARRLVIE